MKALLSVAAIAASVLTAAPAGAAVLGFDDVISSVSEARISNGYAGLNWNNFAVIHKNVRQGSGYAAGTVSGDYVAFNRAASPAAITATTDTFSFDSAWFTSAWVTPLSILIEGFVDGDEIADYSVTLTANTTTPLFFEAGWTDLRSLRFTSINWASQFAMDDLRINEGASTEVPEPLTIGLLGMGLLGVAGARRRKG